VSGPLSSRTQTDLSPPSKSYFKNWRRRKKGDATRQDYAYHSVKILSS
jgi:hypothetical protein